MKIFAYAILFLIVQVSLSMWVDTTIQERIYQWWYPLVPSGTFLIFAYFALRLQGTPLCRDSNHPVHIQMEKQEQGGPMSPLTYGQKAIQSHDVTAEDLRAMEKCSAGFAALIDQMNDLRTASNSQDQRRHASVAITELETAKTRAIQAITWKD